MSKFVDPVRDSRLRWTTNIPRKACEQCQVAKRRCDLERPSCSRCVSKTLDCSFSALLTADHGSLNRKKSHMPSVTQTSSSSISPSSLANSDILSMPSTDKPGRTEKVSPNALDLQDIKLVSTLDSLQIGSRWMEVFIPSSDLTPKALQPSTVQYLSCVLASYPRCMMSEDNLPPIIHSLQVKAGQIPPILTTCFQLTRQWESCRRERNNEAAVAQAVQQEMSRLLSEYRTYRQTDMLAAFQAYLIYTLMAFFTPLSGTQTVDYSTLVSLQDIASHASATGLVCPAELSRARPAWETWIVASAKRRTIYTAYLFNNVFNAINRVETYVAEELTGLPLPATKTLWDSQDRVCWEHEYDVYLDTWKDGEMDISELWRSPKTGSPERRERITRWVQSADEFGMMLFAVCSHIHGC